MRTKRHPCCIMRLCLFALFQECFQV
uniref:Uncharacterized protein n=1 Tax=Rhizophora mucronata TaxID=61149 RepID=A0A2P2QGQ3_RHIMU